MLNEGNAREPTPKENKKEKGKNTVEVKVVKRVKKEEIHDQACSQFAMTRRANKLSGALSVAPNGGSGWGVGVSQGYKLPGGNRGHGPQPTGVSKCTLSRR